MKRPLTLVALLYVIGILLAGLHVSLPLLFTASLFLLVVLAAAWTRKRLLFLCPLILLLGWINLARKEAILSPDHVRILAGTNTSLVTVRGKLCESPQHRVHKEDGKDVWSSMVKIDLEAIQFNKKSWQPAFGTVIASAKPMLPDTVFADQMVEVAGVKARRGTDCRRTF